MTNVSLHLQSRPENVGLAREVLAGLAEAVALSAEQYDDLRTAVTEACNNVVQHAYGDGEGPMDVEVRLLRDAVEVTVRDWGVGMSGVVGESGEEHLAEHVAELEIGLPVMLALADRVQVGRGAYGGTEVQLRFRAPGVEALDAERRRARQPPEPILQGVDASATVSFSSPELTAAILPRLATALAARAHFSADRVSDVQLLADAIAAASKVLSSGPDLQVELGVERRRLDVQLGPLLAGDAERLLERSRPVLERLSDRIAVTSIGPDEVLLLRMLDRP